MTSAREKLLQRSSAGIMIPRRLKLFAVLASVEASPIDGVAIWHADPFWFYSALPHIGGLSGGTNSLRLDVLEDHWFAISNVVPILDLDLTTLSPESATQGGEKVVEFDVSTISILNGVVWFWHAELDDHASIITTPERLLKTTQLPKGWVKCSSHTWKQAIQGIGPLYVIQGQKVCLKMTYTGSNLSWDIQGYDPGNVEYMNNTWLVWEQQRFLTIEWFQDLKKLKDDWFEAMSKHKELQDKVDRAWTAEWFETSDRDALLYLVGKMGPALIRNLIVPFLFGSQTSCLAPKTCA
eukprot:gnl/MRDRNA2_/MRDRNA2_151297_c0_seq1.p1 gnl/MRDRNA2_/MRDRNA2_151297_c0~~gnl/MRDRNA2_/MRDRNA2_151297_c0_seq1.p1  ORF type:complete len:310 (+),score=39.82 gnl/MRDRNA2_/MRDRNA2_151297_c0_seq1:46-930(+)